MTQPRTLTDEKAVMQALWRKALTTNKGLTIPCKSTQEAARLRFALYNGVRAFRKGLATPDELLARALAELTISFTPDKTGLVIGPKAATGMMPQLLAMLDEIPQSVDEMQEARELREAAERMTRVLAMAPPPTNSDTPSPFSNKYGARTNHAN